jgi:hypothetical protein
MFYYIQARSSILSNYNVNHPLTQARDPTPATLVSVNVIKRGVPNVTSTITVGTHARPIPLHRVTFLSYAVAFLSWYHSIVLCFSSTRSNTRDSGISECSKTWCVHRDLYHSCWNARSSVSLHQVSPLYPSPTCCLNVVPCLQFTTVSGPRSL